MAKLGTLLLVHSFTLLELTNGYYMERRSQCFYSSKELNYMVFVDSYNFNKMKMLWFNSTVGKFEGFTPTGIYNAEKLNNDTQYLKQMQTYVNVCKINAAIYFSQIMDKSVEPKIKLRSLKQGSDSQPAVLLCSAYGFYPKNISVTWRKDGKPVSSDVTATEELSDGDWYYQIHAELMYTPKFGEKISCVVEHASLKTPAVYEWAPSLFESEGNKIAIGATALVLGIVVSAAGFIYYKKKFVGPY